MSVFKCKMCGGDLEITQGMSVCECQYCGSKQTLPKLSDEKKNNLYDRAGHFRRNNEYDKAMAIYEQILNEDNEDAESYWSIVLCQYGIEYVEDPATHRRVPTVNRAQLTSIYSDENYKSALKYADAEQRTVYEAEAREIEQIQKGILEISAKEEPFDVFICYKESDANGRRTPDSVLANDLYHQLTQEGFKVFFARITLEDKLGSAYEPYIFAALNSAKVMVVLGTKPEYFTAVWVKNEWSRFLAQIKGGANKALIPAYKDMDPYDLPEEFSHLQAQDMSKLGFMQDLIRGIKKLTGVEEKKTESQARAVEPVPTANGAQALVERAFLFLEDGEFERADELCEQALNQDPKNSQAYVGKLMVERQLRKQESLAEGTEELTENNYFQKALRFAEDGLKKELERCNQMIMDRNKDFTYEEALQMVKENGVQGGIQAAITVLESAIGKYESLLGWRDSEAQLEECKSQKNALVDQLYQNTLELVDKHNSKKIDSKTMVDAMGTAIANLEYLGEYLDSRNLLAACLEKKSLHEKKIRKAKNRKIARIVVFSSLFVIIAVVVASIPTIVRNMKYNSAVACMENEEYEDALEIFEELDGYKNTRSYMNKCNYEIAIVLMEECEYEKAVKIFSKLDGYKDSEEFLIDCEYYIERYSAKYEKAMQFITKMNYEGAISALEDLPPEYKDVGELRDECYYQGALVNMNNGLYASAMVKLSKIPDYKDSSIQMEECKLKQKNPMYQTEQLKPYMTQIAVSYHTVGLKSDGTVVAVGDNQYGQCEVGGWRNIVAVACGDTHTVGLKSDGTVVSVGYSNYSDYGQHEVDYWRNIVAIACSSYHTVGLKSDGTVVAVGNNRCKQCEVDGWEDIVAIEAGNYNYNGYGHTVGLKSNGTVVAVGDNNHNQCNVNDWKDIAAIACGERHTVGLKTDGTVVAVGSNEENQCNVKAWKDIVAVACGDLHTVGLKSDGTVVAIGFNGNGQCDVNDWRDIVAVKAGRHYTIGLKADGTVVTTANDYSVTDWTDIGPKE